MIPGIESLACGPLAVPEDVMAHVVHVESSRNPFAIGVVGGRLLRQPRSLDEAVATVRMLEERGYNYSVGLAQVNRINFARFGFDTPGAGFDLCNNLAAGATILSECLQRHDGRWGDAFSCYYSGNPRTGYDHGYVQKVFAAMSATTEAAPAAASVSAIGLAPDAAASATGSPPSSDARTPWEAVYAARISAPDVRRAQEVSRAQAIAPEGAGLGVIGESTPAVAGDSAPASVPTAQARPSAPASTAPEALFIAEMQQRANALASGAGSREAPPNVAAIPAAAASSAAAPSAAAEGSSRAESADITQQDSNSRLQDAARVF